MNKRLTTLFLEKNYHTDKYNLGYITTFYDELFDKYITPIELLEIGTYGGQSILLWKDYFHSNSIIHTIDVNFCSALIDIKNVEQYTLDAYSKRTSFLFKDEQLDIIIDDGPHTLQSFLSVIELYFSKLKKNGIMIIEDIIVPEWTNIIEDKAKKTGFNSIQKIDMRGKQKNSKLLNKWSNGLDVLILIK